MEVDGLDTEHFMVAHLHNVHLVDAKVEDGQGQEVMEKTKDLVDIKMST